MPLSREDVEHSSRSHQQPSAPQSASGFNPIDIARLRAALGSARLVGKRIIALRETTSTNDVALEILENERDAQHPRAADGWVVIAEHQTAGRGRRGSRWNAPPFRDALFSVILHVSGIPPAALTALAAVAITDAIPELAITWPNDLHAGEKKCAGILVEHNARGGAVLGVGINVNSSTADMPPEIRHRFASLSQLRGEPQDRTALLAAVLTALDERVRSLRAGRVKALEDAWRARLMGRGREARVYYGAERVTGVFMDADFSGTLTLRTSNGDMLTLRGEHVRELRFEE